MRWLLIGLGILILAAALIFTVGAALPVAHIAAVQVQLAAPPESVFAALSDPRSAMQWRSDLQRVDILSDPDQPLRWRETVSMGSVTLVADEVQPPIRFVTRIDDPDQPFGGRWIHVLEPNAAGTLLTITEEGEVYNPLFRFMSRFIFGHHATLERYARDLASRFGSVDGVQRIRSEPPP